MSSAMCYPIFMRWFFIVLLSTIYYLVSTPVVHAASEFTSSYTSTYQVVKDLPTHVIHDIKITNNLAHIFLTRYTFSVSGASLNNLYVTDGVTKLPFTLDSSNGQATLTIQFPNPVIGYNQTQNLIISYDSQDLVESIGETMAINVPRISYSNEAKDYTRIVKVKGINPQPAYLYPAPTTTTTDADWYVYTYTQNSSDSLSLLFGEQVNYQIDLRYLLKNPELSSLTSELALPPDTPYQQIILDQIDPKPIMITLDSDGNYLARYNLKPQEKLWVTARIYATISPVPRFLDPSSNSLPPDAAPPYWDTRSLAVTSLAKQLKSPLNFYNYLIENFHYDYDLALNGTTRVGTTAALENPNRVVCTEFTDTFISLARSNQIASREINGYAYSSNPRLRPLTSSVDVLHSWPEYFSTESKQWLQLDPTWGSTTGGVDYFNKLDFSHIAFVRHGAEPDYPLPPGMYKNDSSEKTISVSVATELPPRQEKSAIINNQLQNQGNVLIFHPDYGYVPPFGLASKLSTPTSSLYDKIKALCVNFFSKFWARRPASM